MLELIALELDGDKEKSFTTFKEIYKYAVKCKSYTELEDYVDKFSM